MIQIRRVPGRFAAEHRRATARKLHKHKLKAGSKRSDSLWQPMLSLISLNDENASKCQRLDKETYFLQHGQSIHLLYVLVFLFPDTIFCDSAELFLSFMMPEISSGNCVSSAFFLSPALCSLNPFSLSGLSSSSFNSFHC